MIKINFLGDSITEGVGATDSDHNFVSLVGKMLPAEVRNYGIGGTRIAKQHHPSFDQVVDQYFASRINKMQNDADLLFVFGGTNDYATGDAPIGNFADKSPDTFYGAVNYLINELLKIYKKEQIIFILPLHRENENSPYGENRGIPTFSLSIYSDIIKSILTDKNIYILDIRDNITMDMLADGLHPNNEGYQKIAELICEYIKSHFKFLL